MSPPEVWGPPIWTFFHKLAENINEEHFNSKKNELFSYIKNICALLPCPECSKDAVIFLGKIDINKIQTKEQFKNLFFIFHNYVNNKKRKTIFQSSNLDIYKKYNLINVYNNFIRVYNTNGNMKLLNESFQRKMLISKFKIWFIKNIKIFVPYIKPTLKNIIENIDENLYKNTDENTDENIDEKNI